MTQLTRSKADINHTFVTCHEQRDRRRRKPPSPPPRTMCWSAGIAPVPPLPQEIRDRLDALYADALAGIPDGDPKAEGISAGAAAAAAMLAARTNDGRCIPLRVGPTPASGGRLRPRQATTVRVGSQVEPFRSRACRNSDGRVTSLTSRAYAREYNEVKTLGGRTEGTARTPDQEALAQFYTVNPVELFNRTFRTIAETEGLTIAEEARLFAMLNLAGADALINCWDDKAHWNFWRPITAIHEGDNDGNPRTVGDPAWTRSATHRRPRPPVRVQLHLGGVHVHGQELLWYEQDGLQRCPNRARHS